MCKASASCDIGIIGSLKVLRIESRNIFGQPIVMTKSEPFWAGDFGRQSQMKQSRRSNQTTRSNLIGYDKGRPQ